MLKPIALRLAILAVIIAGAGGLMAYRNLQASTKTSQPTTATSNMQMPAKSTGEQLLIEKMISHNADAVAMTQYVLDTTQSSKVKTYAGQKNTLSSQDTERLTTWYKSWYGREIPEMTDMAEMTPESSKLMSDLRSSQTINATFISMMIVHDQQSVAMAKEMLSQAKRAELKSYANDLIASQAKDIATLKQLQQTGGQ